MCITFHKVLLHSGPRLQVLTKLSNRGPPSFNRTFVLPATPTRIWKANLTNPLPKSRWYSIMQESPSSEDGRDLIFVRSLSLKATTGVDGWQRPKPQPVLLSLWLKTSVALAGSTDHLPYSIHYGIVCKTVSQLVENGKFNSLEHLAEAVSQLALGNELGGEWVKVAVEKPRALLRADAAGISIVRHRVGTEIVAGPEDDRVLIKELRLVTIIGVNPWERKEKQNVVINLTLHKPDPKVLQAKEFDPHYNFRDVVKAVTDHVENSDYKTVEAFVTAIAKEACVGCGVSKVTVRAEKLSALTFARSAGVEIVREKSFFAIEESPHKDGERTHDAFLALGSNLGDRYQIISEALVELERRGIKIKKTSSLYQSAPMYVTDQPTFLNGVCQVETTFSPEDLLKEVKSVEEQLGRIKTFQNGPRSIDLDILLYDNLTMSTQTLTIPHASMLEREFVLKPLCDISPNRAHPLTSTAFKHHLSAIPPPPADTAPLRTFVSLVPTAPPLDPSNPTRPTQIMAVLNLTPDSFSDGGVHAPMSESLIPTVRSFMKAGATIIDIGGQSTRPGASDVGAEEETRRVVPAVAAIRAAGIDVPISIDTYRACVAQAAVEAGANIINDISAGSMDTAMLPTVAGLGIPVVLMHTRGTPATMNSLAQYGNVVRDVAAELSTRVAAAEAAGVRRWNILLDPGLGFAKTMAQNLELIRRLGELTATQGSLRGLPWVLGPSRKRFVGAVTGVERAGERQWGTAGAVAACVAGGADVVRVHDVAEMKKVVDMAVAIWRV